MSLVLLPILLSFSYAQKATPFTGSSPTPNLYGQATEAMLDRSFPSRRIEYLLLDLHNGQTIAMRWPHSENPIPVGSLLKPFVAAAYAKLPSGSSRSKTLPREFPIVRCNGKTDGCWRRGGHGSLRLEQALAESCNAYFLFLARDLAATAAGVDAMRRVSTSYGLSAPPGSASTANRNENAQPPAALPRIWIGATPEWRVSPMSLAHAYAQFPVQSDDAFVGHLLAGMKLAAGKEGTAAKIGSHPGDVLAKTGTAPCVRDLEPCVASGDGLVVALVPAERPSLLLMVRQRGTTGAQAAETAGKMLGRIEDAHGR